MQRAWLLPCCAMAMSILTSCMRKLYSREYCSFPRCFCSTARSRSSISGWTCGREQHSAMSLTCRAPTMPGAGQCSSSKSLRWEGGGIEGMAARTRLIVVGLLTALKPILSFFLGFFLVQQHLMMQMRKRRRRMAPATATVMRAHLGTGAMFREWSWIEELKPSKTYRVHLNLFLGLQH